MRVDPQSLITTLQSPRQSVPSAYRRGTKHSRAGFREGFVLPYFSRACARQFSGHSQVHWSCYTEGARAFTGGRGQGRALPVHMGVKSSCACACMGCGSVAVLWRRFGALRRRHPASDRPRGFPPVHEFTKVLVAECSTCSLIREGPGMGFLNPSLFHEIVLLNYLPVNDSRHYGNRLHL
jgi:hypothetical protein